MWKVAKTGEWKSGGKLPVRYCFVTPGEPVPVVIEKFMVEEIPYPFSRFRHERERYVVYRLEKRGLDHWTAMETIEKLTGIDRWKIGYAGIKDKRDVTVQYITLPERVDDIETEKLSMRFAGYSRVKFKPGMLEGNRFEIWLRGVGKERTSGRIGRVPNYFGLQRFGKSLDNHVRALEMLHGRIGIRDRVKRFMLHSLQSWIFNEALCRYIESGNVPERLELFSRECRDAVTLRIAESLGIEAWEGRRIERAAFVIPQGLEETKAGRYTILKFSLPKSSYATAVLQEIAKRGIMK